MKNIFLLLKIIIALGTDVSFFSLMNADSVNEYRGSEFPTNISVHDGIESITAFLTEQFICVTVINELFLIITTGK